MKVLINMVFIIISISLAGLIFLIAHEPQWLAWPCILQLRLFLEENYSFFQHYFSYVFYVSFVILLLVFSQISLLFASCKMNKNIFEKAKVNSFEYANDLYLPMYLGYAFVAISLPDISSFILFFILMILILSRTYIFYFNPIFLILGYKFYYVLNQDNSKILIITRKNVKTIEDFFINNDGDIQDNIALTQINELTFLM